MPEFSREAVKVFKALADPTRYQMVRMLLRCKDGELGCVEFERAFDLSKPAMSHHYRVLENAGLVSSRKTGLYVYYKLHRDRLESFIPSFDRVHNV
ncbi:MAG: winged helix-turn-helix transcriptional regulator [Chloroflexi bacterium]|nr:winged helix-turn-helix transcriptional regulator [Chloroflexota bacterium]